MKTINVDDGFNRRRFLGSAALTLAAAGIGVIASTEARAGGKRLEAVPAIKRTHPSNPSSRSTPAF